MENSTNEQEAYVTAFWNMALFDFTPAEAIFVTTLRTLIWLAGFIGSITLIITIWKNNVFHSSGYVLMVNLAAGEVSVATIIMVSHYISVYWYCNRSFRMDLVALDLNGTIEVFAYNITVYFMIIISFNRFCSVVYFSKYKQIFSMINTVKITIGVYIAAFLAVIPFFPGLKIALYTYHPGIWNYFVDVYRGPYGELVFLIYQTIATLTVIVMVIFYTLIMKKLRSIRKVRTSSSTGGSGASPQISRDDVLLCIQFSIVTMIFLCSWVLLAIYTLALPSIHTAAPHKWLTSANLIVWQINFGVNPFVYLIVNKRIRNYMKATLTCRDGAALEAATSIRMTEASVGNTNTNTAVTHA